jgi:hypothetical protein
MKLALQILQQSDMAGRAASSSAVTQWDHATTLAQTADDLFSVNSQNLNKMKIDLYKRVGEALGVRESDYDSLHAYGLALQQAVGQLKLAPNAQLVIAGIEKEIGLDKLGVSLDTVINAIIDPMGDDNDKLDAALQKQIGMDDDGLYTRR